MSWRVRLAIWILNGRGLVANVKLYKGLAFSQPGLTLSGVHVDGSIEHKLAAGVGFTILSDDRVEELKALAATEGQ